MFIYIFERKKTLPTSCFHLMINVISKVLKNRLNIKIGHKLALIKYKPLIFKKLKMVNEKRYLLSLNMKFLNHLCQFWSQRDLTSDFSNFFNLLLKLILKYSKIHFCLQHLHVLTVLLLRLR